MTPTDAPSATGRRRSGCLGRLFALFLLLVISGAALWTWLTLSWAFAEGERAGVLQKFVRRGWVCKTSEGEIALYYGGSQYMGAGMSPQLWDFSVRDPAVAAELSKAVGHRVQLHYTEHPGIPTACFAETRYFVDHVTVTDDESKTPGAGPGATLPGGVTLPGQPAPPLPPSSAQPPPSSAQPPLGRPSSPPVSPTTSP